MDERLILYAKYKSLNTVLLGIKLCTNWIMTSLFYHCLKNILLLCLHYLSFTGAPQIVDVGQRINNMATWISLCINYTSNSNVGLFDAAVDREHISIGFVLVSGWSAPRNEFSVYHNIIWLWMLYLYMYVKCSLVSLELIGGAIVLHSVFLWPPPPSTFGDPHLITTQDDLVTGSCIFLDHALVSLDQPISYQDYSMFK